MISFTACDLAGYEEHVIEQKSDTLVFVQKQLDDIRFIQERYAWFLDSVFKGVGFERKKAREKNLWRSKYICITSARLLVE